MKHKFSLAAACLLATGLCLSSAAQEGHPLTGTWLGTWESNDVHGESVFIVLDWDGKSITGMINPGTDDIPIKSASLDPDGWVVEIEADAKDAAGKTIHYTIEGQIEHLELPNRSIVGTWKSERGKCAFNVSRQ